MMQTYRSLEPTKILTRQELAAVLFDLKRRGRRSEGSRQNLAI
jgi:hypothetical protein